MGLKVGLNARAAHFVITAVLISAFVLLPILQPCLFTLPAYAEATVTEKETSSSTSPDLSLPEQNGIKNGEPLNYSWQSIEGADHYIYESYDDSGLTLVHEHKVVNGTKFERFEKHGAEIWWRVKAVFISGNESSWSEVRRVVVDSESPTIKNITEGDTSRVSGTAVFKFEVMDGYPDKIIASMDGGPMPTSQARESPKELMAHMQCVKVRITLNIDTLKFSDGLHNLTVRAIDHAGNTSDPLEINFLVANAPPIAEKEPEKLMTSNPVEVIQTIAMPEASPIAPILGGEQIITTDAVLPDDSAITHAETKMVQEPTLVNARDHPVERPHINLGWPMWLGFGALLSGTGWWMFSGRKRL